MSVRALPLNKSIENIRVLSRPLAIPGYFALGLLGAVSRLPFVRPTPINWDAVQFELALSHFDLHAHQPHPPGYILYVLAGRLLNAVAGQPGVALALLSVLASALAVPLLAWLALRIFDDIGVALGAALLLAASPLTLYYGSVGLTYAPEMTFSIGVASLAWKLKGDGSVRTAALIGVCLGVAGGVRQTSLLVLLPICLWALWTVDEPGSWVKGQGSGFSRFTFQVSRVVPRLIAFASALIVTCALWFAPLLVMSGGVGAYLHESVLLAKRASAGTSILDAGPGGVADNLAFLAVAIGVGLAFGLVPLGLWTTRLLRFSLARQARGLFTWWTVPALTLFGLTHTGQYGYVLVVLPPLLILSALCVRVLVERTTEEQGTRDKGQGSSSSRFTFHVSRIVHRPLLTLAGCVTLALLSAGYFAFAQGPVTGSNIAENDLYWRAVRSELSHYAPSRIALLMGSDWGGTFRQAGYLLPAYHAYATGKDENDTFGWLYSAYGGQSTYALPHPPAQSYLALPLGTRTLVAMDEETAERLRVGGVKESGEWERVALPAGRALFVLHSEIGDLAGIDIENDTLRPVREGAATP